MLKKKTINALLAALACALCLPAASARPAAAKYSFRVSTAVGLAASVQNQGWSEPLYGENIEYNLASKIKQSANLHVGIGRDLGRSLGVGLGAIIRSGDIDAEASASVPSPWKFASPRQASGSYAATLKATIFYMSLIYRLPVARLSIDVFAGPAVFSSRTQVLSAVTIQDVFPNESVSISLASAEAKKSGFGFHAGLDLNYFFTGNLGVFVEGRYLSGSAAFSAASSAMPAIQINVGGLSAGAGLAYRF